LFPPAGWDCADQFAETISFFTANAMNLSLQEVIRNYVRRFPTHSGKNAMIAISH
jgi:predicted oxidoreductase (fatty acid repression mutant protein)